MLNKCHQSIPIILFILFFASCGDNRITPTELEDFEPLEGRIFGSLEDDEMTGENLFGDYGNDLLIGTDEDDVLNGGHGEDRLEGGEGDDLLISRSDGREARYNQELKDWKDPAEEIDPESMTRWGNKPIQADDVLVGGPGADIFRFITLMNAKERFLEKHTMEDGHIHWHDVAGENRAAHDHWVERIGKETIEDFSREEGDKIEFIGHTLHIKEIEYTDLNEDGIVESIIHLQSKQAPGGAHHKDFLGTVTVFGDKVTRDDYTRDPLPAIGIIHHEDHILEALSPKKGEEELDW